MCNEIRPLVRGLLRRRAAALAMRWRAGRIGRVSNINYGRPGKRVALCGRAWLLPCPVGLSDFLRVSAQEIIYHLLKCIRLNVHVHVLLTRHIDRLTSDHTLAFCH